MGFMRRPAVYAMLVWVLIACPSAYSQSVASLDNASRTAAVAKAAEELRTRYVFPDLGARAAAKIDSELKAGSYDGLTDPYTFAERLTADLRNITRDKHINVVVDGPPPANRIAVAPYASDFGVVRADKLPGNIGYVEVNAFPEPALFKSRIDRALSALSGSRAIIIDLRRNGGGSPDSVAYLVSFFSGKTRVHVNSFISRKAGTAEFDTAEFWTGPTPVSFAGKPVLMLTSSSTFSGGEEFGYDMQVLKLGRTVGEITGGGANPGGMRMISQGIGIFVPTWRAYNPITKANWEGVGVKPDVPASSDGALREAMNLLGVQGEQINVSELSQSQVFAPRMERQANSEILLRQNIEGLLVGAPRYDILTTKMGEVTRSQAAALKEALGGVGPVKSISFVEVRRGMDVYNVTHESGSTEWSLVANAEGKIESVGFRITPGGKPAP
jgi:Peptidase family S41/N-terminal domain of Peptidase_S41 in eukaryotic IRBP